MKAKLIAITTALILVRWPAIAFAAEPIQWSPAMGGNGHFYEYVSTPKTWLLARYDALSRSFNGVPGYLVTITSPQENSFVASLLSTNRAQSAWLSGNCIERKGVWVWQDGPEAGSVFWAGDRVHLWPKVPFIAWDRSEPNNSNNSEDAAAMWGPAADGGSSSSTGLWYDTSSGYSLPYVVEYSSFAAVSEPPSLSQLSNLLVNGNFDSGNVGFTSTLAFSATEVAGQEYTVAPAPHSAQSDVTSFKDHTSGSGLMLIVQVDQPSPVTIWSESVSVAANRKYSFAGWATTWLHVSGTEFDSAPPQVALSINGVQLGTPVQLPAKNGEWQSFTAVWDSLSSTGAVLQLRLLNAVSTGSGIALDDFSFRQLASDLSPAVSVYRSVDIAWPSLTNGLYQVQWSPSFSNDTWFDLGAPVLGRGLEASISDRVEVWDKRFYRVLKFE